MQKIIFAVLLVIISSCASGTKDKVVFQDSASAGCHMVSTVSSSGFSLIPGVGKMVAKSMLVKKAREFNSNTLVINHDEGLFYSKLEATGYHCSDLKESGHRT